MPNGAQLLAPPAILRLLMRSKPESGSPLEGADSQTSAPIYSVQDAIEAVRADIHIKARFILIEYEQAFAWSEVMAQEMKTTAGAHLGEIIYRISTRFSNFRHAKLIVLDNSKDGLKGVSWDIYEDGKKVTLNGGKEQEWGHESTSAMELRGITTMNNDEITATGTLCSPDILQSSTELTKILANQLCQQNKVYSLLSNNCEAFCHKLLQGIKWESDWEPNSGSRDDRLMEALDKIPVACRIEEEKNLRYIHRTADAMTGLSLSLYIVAMSLPQVSKGIINFLGFLKNLKNA